MESHEFGEGVQDLTKKSWIITHSKSLRLVRWLLALLGVFIAVGLPREQYPDVPLFYVHVLVPYPGATAEKIEETVTRKIEERAEAMNAIDEIDSVISDGLSFTRVTFSQSLKEDTFRSKFQELKSDVEQIHFPEGVSEIFVDDFTYLDFLPITSLVIWGDQDIATIQKFAEQIRNKLETIQEVSYIEDNGFLDETVFIDLDLSQLEARGVSLQELIMSIQSNNVSIPAGFLNTVQQKIAVRTTGEFISIDDISQLPVRVDDEGGMIKVEDIARVQRGYDVHEKKIRFNNKNAVELKIYKESGVDSITLVRTIEELIATSASNIPKGLQLEFFKDTTGGIIRSIATLRNNAVGGFILLFIVMLVFLGWRAAVIIALEIPFTFATSFLFLNIFNITLSSSTLFAFVLVLGMLVDTSIVTVENIIRLRHFKGMSKELAAIEGTRQVRFPVLSSTLTTIASFLPLAWLPSFIGKFLLPIPITITVVLLISFASAMVMVPLYYLAFPGKGSTFEFAFFVRLRQVLSQILYAEMKRSVPILLAVFLALGGAILFLVFTPVSLYEVESQPFFFVDVLLPEASSLERTDTVMSEMEYRIQGYRNNNPGKIKHVLILSGEADLDLSEGIITDRASTGQVQIEVFDNGDSIVLNQVMKDIELLLGDVYGYDTLTIRRQRTGPPPIPILGFRIIGADFDGLSRISSRVEDILSEYPEVYNVKNSSSEKSPTITARIHIQEAARLGLSAAEIGLSIRNMLSASPITSIYEGDNKNTDVVLRIGDTHSFTKEKMALLSVPTQYNTLVPLLSVATIQERLTLSRITRENGLRLAVVTAEARDKTRVREINQRIVKEIEDYIATEEAQAFSISRGGEFNEFSELFGKILFLLLIGVTAVYIVLTVEFNSYVLPFVILLTIPFSVLGVSIYIFSSGSYLSISILYSLVALIGVVVNNSIVFVSSANSYVLKRSKSRAEAALITACVRLKPVLLTSITTVAGVLPTAVGLTGRSPIWQPMAITIAIGLSISVFASLLVIPLIYSLGSKRPTRIPPECSL